ncbi:MAG: hypothetical protein U9Q83_06580 [Bacteroidota bacterium]|nr:hypothetical protein [Bacteroidota bacterium]
MSKKIIIIIIFFLVGVFLSSCNIFESPEPIYSPELPENITFEFDASVLENDTIEPEIKQLMSNWMNSASKISVWTIFIKENIGITQNFLEAAYLAPEFVYYANSSWVYEYSLISLNNSYEIKLFATFQADSSVLWEMYVSAEGEEEYLALTGESNYSKTQGNWVFYKYADVSNVAMKIDWLITQESVELTFYNLCETSIFQASNLSLEYFISDTVQYDLKINSYNSILDSYSEMKVNTIEFNGSLKSPNNYDDTLWHCWNSSLLDVDCERVN